MVPPVGEILARLVIQASISLWLNGAEPDCAVAREHPVCAAAARAEQRRTMNPAVPDGRFDRR